MNRTLSNSGYLFALLFAGMLAGSPALADKPEGKGKGKGHERNERADNRQGSRGDDLGNRDGARLVPREGVYFADRHRVLVRDYHGEEFRRGFCPPGLAKKNNGCMPPGQAKKWHIGRPLAREVIYYDLPPRLVVQIGTPPAGYRYVRVASDILLIAIGTGMVIDAINDLGRM